MAVPVKSLELLEAADPVRRALLSGAMSLLLLRAVGPAAASAATNKNNRRLLTITYPAGPSIRFDAGYYRDHHAKLFMDIYGQAIERFELRTLRGSLTGDEAGPSAAAFSALINVWIADFELFHARSTEAAYKRMGDDKTNFSNTSSSVQVDEVRYEAGEPRASVSSGCDCLSLLHPAGGAGSWNDEARCRAYVKGVMSLLGSKALRRIELRHGLEQLDDGSPTYQGGANLYVRNPADFAAAWRRHAAAVQKLSTQLCSVSPIQLSTTVVGIVAASPNG